MEMKVGSITKGSHTQRRGKMGGEGERKEAFRGVEMDGWVAGFLRDREKENQKEFFFFLNEFEETTVSGCEGGEWIKECPWT